ncbi:MAG: hypothetical protein SGPRY_013462 [Prymnesium sp.]
MIRLMRCPRAETVYNVSKRHITVFRAAQMKGFDEREGEGEEEFIDLDLEKTLTWTGNAVIIQAGGEFRLPLMVPHPSVLMIQFEVEDGYDIEFSLLFKDDEENDYQKVRRATPLSYVGLVEPNRVSDREGQLDIDTTGICELLWSNSHAWMSSKVSKQQGPSLLSCRAASCHPDPLRSRPCILRICYPLAPKLDMQKKRWIDAIISASQDYRVVSAAEASEQVDNSIRTLVERTATLKEDLNAQKLKETEAQQIHERYSGHVKRLEEEVAAAKRHVEQAAADLSAKQRETAQTQRSLAALEQMSTLDKRITDDITELLEPWIVRFTHSDLTWSAVREQKVDEPLNLIYDAWTGTLFTDEDEKSPATSLDRAEFIHFLQV